MAYTVLRFGLMAAQSCLCSKDGNFILWWKNKSLPQQQKKAQTGA